VQLRGARCARGREVAELEVLQARRRSRTHGGRGQLRRESVPLERDGRELERAERGQRRAAEERQGGRARRRREIVFGKAERGRTPELEHFQAGRARDACIGEERKHSVHRLWSVRQDRETAPAADVREEWLEDHGHQRGREWVREQVRIGFDVESASCVRDLSVQKRKDRVRKV
jgi:hypothetical protein